MELGDGMMSRNARILVVAIGLVVLGLGTGYAGPSSGASGPRIRLRCTESIETVHYSPQPGVWVVDMPELGWPDRLGLLSDPDIGIAKAELSRVEEFGKVHARLTVELVGDMSLDVSSGDGTLLLSFTDPSSRQAPAAVPETPEAEPLVGLPPVVAAESSPHQDEALSPISLDSVDVTRTGDGIVVHLKADSPIDAKILRIPAPDRLVLDFDGVIDRVDSHVFDIGSADIRRVRLAQHQGFPHPVTRMVVDMESPLGYKFEARPDGGILTVGSEEVPSEVPPAPATPVVVRNMTITNLEGNGEVRSLSAVSAPTEQPAQHTEEIPSPEAVVESAADALSHAAPEITNEDPPASNPWVADPHQLMEESVAAQELDLPQPKGESYETTEVDTGEVQFTGDPITLTLKDADIKDVLKTFSALTHLNIVIDPEVRGIVTVELRDVPWDQALDLILRINGLDYVLENNVLRVSTVAKLTQEKNLRAQYLAQQETAQPLKTVVKPLSYAKASQVKSLLSGDSYLMSSRGSVVVDDRTNTLIIRDTIDRVEGVLRLIDTLDQPTPQVVIEGRIVETTKTFSRSLGIQWSFEGTNDAEHGNATGWAFPSNVSTRGGVNLGASEGSAGFIGLSFGDILNTFNLDFLLSAAENEGDAKIVSTPRVTTQNLKQATIRSGLQIPVQTVANDTVTVQYIDATLRLQVTPQITAEGTVNLDIEIVKRQPLPAGMIVGGTNAPILTRDAKTELLVRDGGTTVIGGIYQIDTQENENRVPGLSKIPVLGGLFRSHSTNSRHDELLIFITPRIVKY